MPKVVIKLVLGASNKNNNFLASSDLFSTRKCLINKAVCLPFAADVDLTDHMNIIHDLCDLEERTSSSLKISYIVRQTLTVYANQGPEHLFFYFSSQLTGKSGRATYLTNSKEHLWRLREHQGLSTTNSPSTRSVNRQKFLIWHVWTEWTVPRKSKILCYISINAVQKTLSLKPLVWKKL